MFCMCWIWLFLAIFFEVAATTLMKMSNGLTRTAPTVGIFVLYGLSFVPMTIALKQMEIGGRLRHLVSGRDCARDSAWRLVVRRGRQHAESRGYRPHYRRSGLP